MARIIPLGDQNDMLRQRMPEFDFSNPIKDPADLTATLLTTMKDNRGLGLAANQIGIPTRALAILTEPPEVLFNPKITYMSDEQENLNEGCLSYPGVYVKYQNLHGEIQTRKFKDMAAKVIQHEVDHLDGIEYFKRAHTVNLERFKRKWEKMRRVLKKVAKTAK